MSARRQSSTTSLSKYARADDADYSQRSLDFCNAFWGIADQGVDVLFARMRGAARTVEELRAFWKERAAIEEDYAKRLTALAKKPLGRDEIGELRNSFDTLRLETANQGSTHQELTYNIRRIIESGVAEFIAKQATHRKTFQAQIEKQYKAKQTQESYVEKAREKYEQDCVRINSYTAQSTLVQGRDYDKLQLKLDRVRQTVQANENDFRNFQRALADTCAKWEKDWRTFCDQCQDLEEERIDFVKNNMWTFANAVSTACVSDDESCEKLRVALEQVDAPVEQENFVRDYGTGNDIHGPMPFVDYKKHDPHNVPQPEVHIANFVRSSALPPPSMRQPVEDDAASTVNQAGIGAGGGQAAAAAAAAAASAPAPSERARSRASSRARSQVMESAPPSSESARGGPPPSSFVPPPPMPAQQPQQQQQSTSPTTAPQLPPIAASAPFTGTSAGGSSSVGDAADPLARTLENLRSTAGSTTGRLSSAQQQHPQQQQQQQQQQQPPRQPSRQAARSPSRASSRRETVDNATASGSRQSTAGLDIDYRMIAESIVGAHPSSRPSSPSGAPTAKFMQPPQMRASPVPVEEVVSTYSQALPGEHAQRRLSRQNSVSRTSVAETEAPRGRPVSREGHAGIGANGRAGSISPAPPAVRHQSGMSMSAPHQQQQRAPSPMRQPSHTPQPSQRAASPMYPQHSGASAARPLGIAFDADGRVTQDALAERYAASSTPSGYHHHQQTGSYPTPAPQQQQQQQQYAQPSGFTTPAPSGFAPAASPAPTGFTSAGSTRTSFSPPGSAGYTQQQQQQPQPQQYRGPPVQPPPIGFPPPTPTPAQYYQQQIQQQQQQQVQQQQQQAQQQQAVAQHQQRQSSGYTQPNGWQSPHQQQASGYQQSPQVPVVAQTNGYVSPGRQSAAGTYAQQPVAQPVVAATPVPQQQRAPSPQPAAAAAVGGAPVVPPTGQYVDDGKGVLFYVKALYDYQATIDEEFDFQAGDVIAVTSTPEDGWWSGWLLDDTRRVPGRHVFPSNFVCLF